MDFNGFLIGLRFPIIENRADQTAELAWSLIFSTLSADEAAGMELHQTHMDSDPMHKADTLVCVLSNMSLSKCRRIYARLAANPALRSYQSLYEPYILSNRAELMDTYNYLGHVLESGIVTNGECSYSSMCFHGTTKKKSLNKHTLKFLVCAASFGDLLTAEQSVHEILCGIGGVFSEIVCVPFPLFDNACSVIENLILLQGGRYVSFAAETTAQPLLTCGVLPDRTFTFAAASENDAIACLQTAYEMGYRRFIVGLDESVGEESRCNVLSYMQTKLIEAEGILADDLMDAEKYLDYTAFQMHSAGADTAIVCGDIRSDHFKALLSEIRKRCEATQKNCLVLSYDSENNASSEDAIASLHSGIKNLIAGL